MKQYQQILIAAVPVLAALVVFSPHGVVLTLLIFGDGHSFTTYLYQYRGGKMTTAYRWRFLASLAVIGVFLFATHWSLPLLTLATSVVFVTHFLIDEIYLLKLRIEPLLVSAALPVFLLYVASLSDKLLNTSVSTYAVIGFFVCAGIYLAGMWQRRQVSYGGLWLLLMGAILVGITFYDISPEKLLATVILFHYTRWLVFYGDRYWKTPRFVSYLRDVIVIQGVIILLFFWYAFSSGIGHTLLMLLFTETGFYVLTVLHIFTTARTGDYKDLGASMLRLLPSFRKE